MSGSDGDVPNEMEVTDGESPPKDVNPLDRAAEGLLEDTGSDSGRSDSDKDASTEKEINDDKVPVVQSGTPDISVETTDGDNIDTAVTDNDLHGNLVSLQVGRDQVEQVSEKSFTSDTDSSALAEAVVKTVISKAVDVVKSADSSKQTEINKGGNGDEISGEPEKLDKPGDIKVGLFQYQELGFGEGGVSGTDSDMDIEEDLNKEKDDPEKDHQVGLFQYADMEESEKSKSPEVSEIDGNGDENNESLNEEDRANIMKLYGLDNVTSALPISPKSASPSENDVKEEIENEMVIDVQRQVYEPQARSFSLTQETSSSESTPRQDENNGKTTLLEDIETPEPDGTKKNDMFEEYETDAVDDVEKNQPDEGDKPEPVTSISPPLIQYESVTENGKFRIIKTTKEGAGIRVGGDISNVSPKGSSKQSPRGDPTSETESVKSEDSKASKSEKIADVKVEEKVDVVNRNTDNKEQAQGTSLVSEQIENKNDTPESQGLDMNKIKAVLEKENDLKLSNFVSKDNDNEDANRSTADSRDSPRQISVSDLKTTAKSDGGIEVNFGNRSDVSVDSYDWTARRSVEGSYGGTEERVPAPAKDLECADLYQPRTSHHHEK